MLVEPPRPRAARGPRPKLTATALVRPPATAASGVRIAALAAAAVLALTSKGDVTVLAAALAVGATTWPSTVSVVLGLGAASLRVGATSMRAIAGAQSVLGPAGWNGSSKAVVASWLAAAAVTCAARPLPGVEPRWAPLPVGLAFGATAAAIVAGPGPGGALAVRVVVTVIATAVAAAVIVLRSRRVVVDRAVATAGVGLGALAALVAVLAR